MDNSFITVPQHSGTTAVAKRERTGTPASPSVRNQKSRPRRILYVGDTLDGSTSRMRLETLQRLGHSVYAVPRFHPARGLVARAITRVRWKLAHPPDSGLNQAVLTALSQSRPDVLWCDRSLDIRPETLKAAKLLNPSLKIVAYSVDDMLRQPHNQSVLYRRSIPLYDLHVTTKSYNLDDLAALGARHILFVNNAFSPRAHFPMQLSPSTRQKYGGPVGFVGTYERERAEMLLAMAKQGIPVRVWGGSWPERLRSAAPNLRIEGRDLMADSYRLALNSFDINLGFLRKISRDVQTTRSMEIPACGGFLLAERSDEHRALFQEGREAAYFSSTEELITKVQFYLENAPLRKKIAAEGFRRAVTAPYTYEAQLENVLAQL
jgi:spore maturation protein CgeB